MYLLHNYIGIGFNKEVIINNDIWIFDIVFTFRNKEMKYMYDNLYREKENRLFWF